MKICIPIINPKDISKANKTKADFLELRTDLYKKFNLKDLTERCKKPVIVTIKNKKLLQEAINFKKVKFIDLDYRNRKLINCSRKLIISYHNFKKTPDYNFLNNLIKRGVNKIAVKIGKVEDNLIVDKLVNRSIIALGIGELGIMTRLDKRNLLSYFALSKNKTSAPGQLTIDQVGLKLYGLIGYPAKHSLSPAMHNTWFKKYKINALYQVWETRDLKKMMQIFRAFNLAGASVTTPYKQEVMKYLDVIDPEAKKIGAVNTIVNKKGKLYGYNTDWYGIVKAINQKNKKIIILGRGGAARAAKYGLEKLGNKVKPLGRKEMKKFQGDYDILINATPVTDKLLIDLKPKKIVMDMIYHKETKLLKEAEKKNCLTMNGLTMLKFGARKQLNLWQETL